MPPASPASPASPGQMFVVFNNLALQGFGGVLAVAQRHLVEQRRWLTKEEFLAVLSLGQVLPGPNIVNMALMIGQRFFGWRGAFASLAGLMLAPLCIVLVLAALFGQISGAPAIAGALRGMGAVAAGLVMATALKLAAPLRASPMGLGWCLLYGLLTFAALGLLRWPMVWVVLVLGSAAVATAWRKLRR